MRKEKFNNDFKILSQNNWVNNGHPFNMLVKSRDERCCGHLKNHFQGIYLLYLR